jgi:CRISPR-associated endoribonuclease Cas6
MIIRSTWTLNVTDRTVLPKTYGMGLVKELHDRLGITLGEEQIPSTSFAGLLGYCDRSIDFITFFPDETYTLTLCGLQAGSSKAIAAFDLGDSLKFFGAEFKVCDRRDQITSYEDLYTAQVASEPEPHKQFDLQFLTPTAFSRGRSYLPLPLPELIFRSWLERWNHFAPVYLGADDLIAYLSSAVAIRHHKIQTQPIQIHQANIKGFTGHVSLQILQRADPLLANVANLLIQYAQYTGTGIKTRLGMGQTEVKFRN